MSTPDTHPVALERLEITCGDQTLQIDSDGDVYALSFEGADRHLVFEQITRPSAWHCIAWVTDLHKDRADKAEAKAERLAKVLTARAVEHEFQAKDWEDYGDQAQSDYHAEQAKIARMALDDSANGGPP